MDSIIIYSQTHASPDHTVVLVETPTEYEYIHIRAEFIKDKDPEEALLAANPRKYETVLNAIPFPA